MGEDGGEHDSSPRNLEGRGKNCTGNITSLAKVPRKCQNKMCWLRFGDEKSIPGVPEANPSTSQHPSQAEELVTCQFSSAPWTAPPESPCRVPSPHVPRTRTGTTAKGRDGLPPTLFFRNLPSGSREKSDRQGTQSHSTGCSLVLWKDPPSQRWT